MQYSLFLTIIVMDSYFSSMHINLKLMYGTLQLMHLMWLHGIFKSINGNLQCAWHLTVNAKNCTLYERNCIVDAFKFTVHASTIQWMHGILASIKINIFYGFVFSIYYANSLNE